jgi:valyl-tRNA synthetase
MSKSKGNVLDPLDLIDGIDLESLVKKRTTGLMRPQDATKIEKATRKEFANGIPAFGTDALRFTFASQATLGRNINFDLGRIEGYRNFCNKLWNAARYVLMNTEGKDCGQAGGELALNAADRWIVSRLHETAAEVDAAFRDYRFDLAAQAIYGFTWNEYCDWYLELSKVVLTDSQAGVAAQRGTRHTLVNVLETLLRLLHPIMPFITEEIWQRVATLAAKTGETVMLEPYPAADRGRIDTAATDELRWLMGVISAVRTIRAERDIPPSKALPVWLADGDARERAWADANRRYLIGLARMQSLDWIAAGAAAPESAIELVGQTKVLVPLGSLINKQEELARLRKEIEKVEKDLGREQGQLANADFVARAPAQVVEEKRGRVREFEAKLAKLSEQRARVAALPG